MDTSSLLQTLLSASSVAGISSAANASKDDVTKVLSSALPVLLQGASSQANTASTASSFASALEEHAKDDTSNISSFLKNVNLADGAKIVTHLLGNNATQTISKEAGVDAGTTKSVLSAAAPLFMSLLGKQTSGTSENALGNLLSGAIKNVNIGSLLGGLLGSGSGSSSGTQTTANSATNTGSGKTGGLLGGLMGLLK